MPYAENGGVRVYYEVEGDGPPLVLHPGFMMRLQDWRREDGGYVRALREAFRLILMDPRGQGRSDRPHDAAAYRMETRARDIAAVLDAEGVERAHFWGYSMGAMYGFALGLYVPERCRSLILGGDDPYANDRAAQHQMAAQLRRGTMDDFITGFEARLGMTFPPAVRERFVANDPLALAAAREARATDPDLGDRVATITAPALIYAGDRDEPFAGAQRAASAMPGATFVAMPGMDHGEAFDAAEAILPHVRAFLARVD